MKEGNGHANIDYIRNTSLARVSVGHPYGVQGPILLIDQFKETLKAIFKIGFKFTWMDWGDLFIFKISYRLMVEKSGLKTTAIEQELHSYLAYCWMDISLTLSDCNRSAFFE